jgi:hypothetical protein
MEIGRNVDSTSDLNKPGSNSTQTELDKEITHVESNLYRNTFRNFKSNG